VEKFTRFFHAMENILEIFPQYGKFQVDFSTLWKKFLRFFHSMENFLASFPRYGKKVSTPWKTGGKVRGPFPPYNGTGDDKRADLVL